MLDKFTMVQLSNGLEWHCFFKRDAAGLTFAQRWEQAGFAGLEKNDERALLRAMMQPRLVLLEIHRVLDSQRTEAVDLLAPGSAPLLVMDRSLAASGLRNWEVAGMFVDLLGPVETFSRTPFRRVQAPYGEVLLMKPEDLLVERVLVSVYPQSHPPARDCARKLASLALSGALELDWAEVRRLASLPEYGNLSECQTLLEEVADELKLPNPLHSS